MNLDEIFEATSNPPDPKDNSDDVAKFIRNINKVSFNMMIKNNTKINAYMKNLAGQTRGFIKQNFVSSAEKLFKESKVRSNQYRSDKEKTVNKFVDRMTELLPDDVERDYELELEMLRPKFESELQLIKRVIEQDLDKRENMFFFAIPGVPERMLNTKQEKEYNKDAIILLDYFIRNTLKMRSILSIIQTVIHRVVKKSNQPDVARKVLVKFVKSNVQEAYGAYVGKLLSEYITDFYSSNDSKKSFQKFEGFVGFVLGLK